MLPTSLAKPGLGWRGADTERRSAASLQRDQSYWASHRIVQGAVGDLGARSAPNLESVSHNYTPLFVSPDSVLADPAGLHAKLVQYPDSVRATLCPYRPPRRAGKCTRIPRPDAERLACNVRRAKCMVRHKIRCFGGDHLWTFTRRGKFATVDDLWLVWARFERLAMKRWPGFQYVAVPERHADGQTWHLHVAVKGMRMVESLRKMWSIALGGTGGESGPETLGNVNAKYFKGRGSKPVYRYISKYVGEDIGAALCARKSYSCSRGIVPLSVRRFRASTWGVGGMEAMKFLRGEVAALLGADPRWYPSFREFEGGGWIGWCETGG